MKKNYSMMRVLSLSMLLLGFMLLPGSVQAQTVDTAYGVVVDELGDPLVGVNILFGTRGAITNMDGEFILENVELGSTLIFQFIGMETTEVKFEGKPIRVVMKDNSIVMDEVIITGFGTIKKSAFAGSASSMKTDVYKDVPVGNVTSLLEGTVSGVVVSSLAGGPGSTNEIRVRGFGSYTASNSPLYVIDGVPVRSGAAGFSSSSNEANLDIMATINPNDIESMTVIKDAAAASLYGSRAANGVILIVTKSGKQGKAKVNLRQDFGFTDFAYNYRRNLKGDERRQFVYDGMIRRAKYIDGKTDEEAITYANENIDIAVPIPWNGQWTDWEDLLFRKGSSANTEISLSGATDKFNYYTSLGYTKQEGITYIQELERYSFRTNVDYHARNNLLVGAKIAFSKTSQDYGMDNMAYNSPMYGYYHKITDSDFPYNEDGSYNRELLSNGRYNPVASQDWDIRNRDIQRFLGTAFAELTIIPELKVRSTLSYDFSALKEYSYSDPRGSGSPGENGSFSKEFRNVYQITSNTQAQYIKELAPGHNFDALLAYEASEYNQDHVGANVKNFLNPDLYQTSNGDVSSASGYVSQWRMVSYVSYANYNYRNKYFVGGNYRIDGTSRLKPSNRWGHFWSASAAWRFSSESFMESINDIITDAKLRMSYGQNGNQPSDYYAGLATLSLETYNGNPAMVDSSPVASDLRWEKNGNFNIGIDLNFWNRINFTAEYYTRKTTDLLLNSPISYTSGMSSYLMNIGNIRNSGVEFTIDTRNIVKKDFTWSSNLTLTTNKSKVLKLADDQEEITSGNHIRKIGHGFYNYYLVEFAGINPNNGNGVFWINDPEVPRKSGDHWLNEDGSLNTALATEKQSAANPIITNKPSVPKVYGGLNNTFRYKIFDLSFLFTYSFGGWSEDNAMQKSRTAGYGGTTATYNQIPAYYRDSWKKPGDIASVEGWFYNNPNREMYNSSTARLHSTDHLRLKSLTFGINLPTQWVRKAGIERLRFYTSGTNLLTWAAYKEYDPEVPLDGQVQYQTPPMKNITFGFELVF